jgi:hypothetical protein
VKRVSPRSKYRHRRTFGRTLVAALWLLLPLAAARADALADVRATLQKLSSDAPVKGTLDVRSEQLDQKEDDPQPPGHIQLHIEADSGLAVHLAPDLLNAVNREERANGVDANKPTPTADLLRSTGPTAIGNMVSAAPNLLQALEGATAPVVKPDRLDGSPVQQLTVQVPIRANKRYRSYAYGYRGSLVLWLDAQGVPLASQQNFHAKFCRFFLCITVDEHHSTRLKVVDGRLVATSAIEEFQQSGLGQGSHTRQTYNLQLDSP